MQIPRISPTLCLRSKSENLQSSIFSVGLCSKDQQDEWPVTLPKLSQELIPPVHQMVDLGGLAGHMSGTAFKVDQGSELIELCQNDQVTS